MICYTISMVVRADVIELVQRITDSAGPVREKCFCTCNNACFIFPDILDIPNLTLDVFFKNGFAKSIILNNVEYKNTKINFFKSIDGVMLPKKFSTKMVSLALEIVKNRNNHHCPPPRAWLTQTVSGNYKITVESDRCEYLPYYDKYLFFAKKNEIN